MARILICDDSMLMRMMLKKILNNKGHEVVAEASNGQQAVELYQKWRPDITTMDIIMPEPNGLEALKLIRAVDGEAKVVMVSSMGQRGYMAEAFEAGASDFLVKPFEEEQVDMVVNMLLRSAEPALRIQSK